MFTGIIEEVGQVHNIEPRTDGIRLTISASTILNDAHHGDSIAVNGVCLTITEHTTDTFSADVMQVSLDYSTLGTLRVGSPVNLERAMPANGRFGGHIVQGHVDGTATLLHRQPSDTWEVFAFGLDDKKLASYLIHKGSIAINGTSLTIAELDHPPAPAADFTVSLIPTTMQDTMLSQLEVGDKVNIECDVLAKYVARLSGNA